MFTRHEWWRRHHLPERSQTRNEYFLARVVPRVRHTRVFVKFKSSCTVCEGNCNAWVHKTCLGLNKQAYDALSESDSPYLCPHCMINKQTQEIDSLKQLVKASTNDLALIKNRSSASGENLNQSSASYNDSGTVTNKDTIAGSSPNRYQTTFNSSMNYPSTDRKFNVIVYGIDENPPNTKRHARLKNDISFS